MARCRIKYSSSHAMEGQRGDKGFSWLYDISGASQKQISSQGEVFFCKAYLCLIFLVVCVIQEAKPTGEPR